MALVALIAGAAIYLVVAGSDAEPIPGTIDVEGSTLGAPFTLTATDGGRVTDAEVIDRPVLIYFGYASCADICPAESTSMATATDLLAEHGIEVRPVFISIDPERDTPEALGEFVAALHPDMVGLTGSVEELMALIRAYGGYFEKDEMPDPVIGYTMRQTGYIYLVVPGNRVAALFRRGTAPENIAAEAARVLH